MAKKYKGSAIGIDLGTTYSCVAVWQEQNSRAEIIHNDQGNRTTPSCVAFTDTQRLIGDAAKNQAASNTTNTVFVIKRLVKALGVKTRREAKRMALMDGIASVKGRVEDVKTSIQDHRTKNEQYATIVSQHRLVLAASEEKSNQSIQHKDETEEAISWYNRVLGFHVEGGHGVKFTFKNINVNNPNEEYFFTIRHEDETYTLLKCEPSLKDTNELIHELNKTNGLFKFVRIMRKKFQEGAQGSLSMIANEHQESALISDSAPLSSLSTIRSYSVTEENEHQGEPKKKNTRRRGNSAVLTPGSASSIRQSPRLKARK